MRRTLASVLGLALIFSFALTVIASESAANPKAMTCTIKKVDTVSSTVTVANPEAKQITFNVDPTTKITIDGKDGTLADLKEGQAVKLTVDGNKALSIEA